MQNLTLLFMLVLGLNTSRVEKSQCTASSVFCSLFVDYHINNTYNYACSSACVHMIRYHH